MINYNESDKESHNGIGAVILNEEGQVLVQDHVKFGFWTLPIGKSGVNEDPREGMNKELLEECNVEAEKLTELSRITKKDIRDGVDIDVTVILYHAEDLIGEIRNNEPDKHREQKFMDVDEFKKIYEESGQSGWINDLFFEWLEKNKEIEVN